MEQEGHGKNRQAVLQFRCEKILPRDEKKSDAIHVPEKNLGIEVKQDSGISLALLTPERKILPTRTKKNGSSLRNSSYKEKGILKTSMGNTQPSAEDPNGQEKHGLGSEELIKVPDKYNLIAEFFDRMECSVRLLSLRKKLPTFRNISTQVEIMTKRKLLYSHLAQMKHVFPEAILIEKVLVHDKESLCVIPDLKINFCPDVVQCHVFQKPVSVALCQAFRARLLDFDHVNHECFDIPEAPLPEPFQPSDQNLLPKELLTESSIERAQPDTSRTNFFSKVTHFCSSTSKHLSQTSASTETKNLSDVLFPDFHIFHNDEKTGDMSTSMGKDSPLFTTSTTKSNIELVSDVDCSIASTFLGSTPVKLESNPCKTTVGTRPPQTLKTLDSPSEKMDVEDETCVSLSARRTLIFSPTKLMENAQHVVVHGRSNSVSSDYQMFTAKTPRKDDDASENLATKLEVQDEHCTGAIEQNRKDRQMLTNLCSLVNTIRIIFQSINGRSMTKQELLHKILSYNYDIEETTEVEEQLHLLQSLVPDWICEKTMPTGDLIYSIEKSYDPESVCASITTTRAA